MKKTKLLYLLLVVMIFGIASCSSDDEPEIKEEEQEEPIDIDDPDAVAESITFKNGTSIKIEEPFPVSSTDENAPILYSDSDDAIAIAGGVISVPLYASSTIKGVYLQVKGTNYYYDVTLNQTDGNARFSNSRKTNQGKIFRTKEAGVFLLIETKDGLQSGDLCIKYAVYDEAGRVSNVIEKCTTIKAPGGANSSFLTANSWTLESLEYFGTSYDGEPYEEITIVGETYTSSSPIWCPDTAVGEFQEEYVLISAYLTLLTDGKAEMIFTESYKAIDGDLYCETGEQKYETEVEEEKDSGHWSFDDTKKELHLISQVEEYGVIYHDVVVYKVTHEDGKLILLNEIHEEDISGKLVFTPKK